MSEVVYLPDGYEAGDLLVFPAFVSNPDARINTPENWDVITDSNGNPLEQEHQLGFMTAFWKVAENDEPDEVELSSDDNEAQVVGQIIAFGKEDLEESPGEPVPSGWRLPPVGEFGGGEGFALESGAEEDSGPVTEVFTATDVWEVPPGVFQATVECWGAGGPASNATHTPNAQNGGGGGAYASSVVSLTPGELINISVPDVSSEWTSSSAGSFKADDTIFNDGEVLAEAGTTTNSGTVGVGGQAVNSVGDIVFSGGDGGIREATNAAGGGGGGAGGPTADGADGSAGAAGIGGAGGAGNSPGGDGGDGGNTGAAPTAGNAPGGGAGGRGLNGSAVGIGGGTGQVSITYTPVSGWYAELFGALNIRAGDQLLLANVLSEDNDISNDELSVGELTDLYGSGLYGAGPFGGNTGAVIIEPPLEIDEAYTGVVTFRTAVAGVVEGSARSIIAQLADLAVDDFGMMLLVSLRTTAGDEYIPIPETQVLDAEKNDAEIFATREGVSQELFDTEIFDIEEDALPFIGQFDIIFNESRIIPGFDITLGGLLEFSEIEVIRRDVLGRYPDQKVRGLARQITVDNEMFVVDYEAPLNVELHYYIRLINDEGEFIYGPRLPEPQPYIPTLDDAYGGGTAFIKPIDIPELGFPAMIEEMDSWTRPANKLAEHHVLGRKNKVIITDVRGGIQGTLSGHCILQMGQSIETVEAAVAPGATMLIQNHNTTTSGLKDMYVQLGDVSFDRFNKVSPHGELENPRVPMVIITFSADYTQVDRPDPSGVELPNSIWQVVYDTWNPWEQVRANRETWLDLLIRPAGPGTEESS